MRSLHSSRRIARLVLAALAMTLFAIAPAATATARQGVYGGMTKAGDPIVLNTDAKGQKLASVVFRVVVDGTDDWWPIAGKVAVRAGSSDPTTVQTGVLVADRNKGGRFSASLVEQLGSSDQGTFFGGIHLKGSLKPGKATGTISGWATITDPAGRLAGSFQTKSIKWTAERSAGRVYAGATGASLPIIIKLDRKRSKVATLAFSTHIRESSPPGYFFSSSEMLANFPLSSGRFADEFDDPRMGQDGTTTTFHYNIAGRVTRSVATGALSMSISGTNAGQPLGFAMPATKFKAATG